MSFNKWYPDRLTPAPRVTPLRRALMLRGAVYVSIGMLMLGYVLIAMALTGRL